MHVCQVFLRIHLMTLLQAAQRGSIHFEILLAQDRHICLRDGEPLKHIEGHPLLDGVPEAGRGGIERIVEVEKQGGKTHV